MELEEQFLCMFTVSASAADIMAQQLTEWQLYSCNCEQPLMMTIRMAWLEQRRHDTS